MNRYVLVTGGTRGIGRAIAGRLLSDGHRVLATGRTAANKVPDGCAFMACDFWDRSQVETLLAHVANDPPDILVNNAGVNFPHEFVSFPDEDYYRIQKVNLEVPFLLCKAVIPNMLKRGWGRIINVTSIWGVVGKEQRAPYCASKFALDGLTTALAAEVARKGILVNAVAPGFVLTEATKQAFDDELLSRVAEEIPIRRLARPEEIAAFVSWLVSDENTYISGQNLVIDGGLTRV